MARRVCFGGKTLFRSTILLTLLFQRKIHCVEHVKLSKMQYVESILGTMNNLEAEYFLLVCQRGLTKEQLEKYLVKLRQVCQRLGMRTVFSIEQQQLNQLEHLTKQNTMEVEDPDEEKPRPQGYLYFKSKHFEKMIRVSSFEPDKVYQRVKAVQNLVVQNFKQEDLPKLMDRLSRDFDTPLLIKHIGSKQQDTKFKSKIHDLVDQGILNQHLKIVKTKTPLVIQDRQMQQNDLVLCNNDLQAQLRTRYTKSNKCISFDQWKSEQRGIGQTDSLKRFLLPSISLITQTNYQRQLLRLFSIFHIDRTKDTISLRIKPNQNNSDKLRLFYELYHRYHNNLNFVVITTSLVQQLFVHSEHTQPQYVIFNFFNRVSTKQSEQSVRRPYSKAYLGSYNISMSFSENYSLFDHMVRKHINEGSNMKQMNVLTKHLEQQINIDKLNNLMKSKQMFVLRHCYKRCSDRPELLTPNIKVYWIDLNEHNVKDYGDLLVQPHTSTYMSL